MEKELLQKCNLIAQNASIVARDEIRLFCQIMDWSDADVYFVADDPHGVVSLGDYFFNMSDIHEVVANYEKLVKAWGSKEELYMDIIKWYDWTTDYHHRHPVMEWVKIRTTNKFTGKPHYIFPEDGQEVMIKWGVKATACTAMFRAKMKDYLGNEYKNVFCPKRRDDLSKYETNVLYGKRPDYWCPVTVPTDEHYINLSSWLKGACDLVKS